MLETQIDNYDTVEDAIKFMTAAEFAENPIGTDFDVEVMVTAIQNGLDESVLKKRKEIGRRGMPDLAKSDD
ncbi:hypothetical protein BDV27DRAFT_164151 [Aspergillus caelatus]|uniref:Uncharacterized protein n=1 Tax=Aspergillus caelatus TaxID=61420 RepID=A0A5N6ZLY7_9EURO|nr:uncharacterized protein BDV27DRAFT_164151 [Aspergillus caelatus]KAE8357829.1 hypothetical protein BDV27DRAFT_164151 [Aspergillus caelatus]